MGKEHQNSKQDDEDASKYQDELKGKMKDLENGPISTRRCTDIPCCLLFVAFIVGFFVTAGWGMQNGDPRKLVVSWDQAGNACGWAEGFEDYPYLYWPEIPGAEVLKDVEDGDLSSLYAMLGQGICVSKCPVEADANVDCKKLVGFQLKEDGTPQERYKDEDGKPSCAQYIDANDLSLVDINLEDYLAGSVGFSGDRFPFIYNTTQAGGFCMPNVEEAAGQLQELGNKILDYFYGSVAGDSGQAAMSDIALSANVIAWSCLTALILGYLFLFVIRCIGGAIIYLFLILIELCFTLGGLYVHFHAQTYNEEDPYKTYIQYGAYTLWGLGALQLVCMCCCWSAIKVAIAVYKTTAQYVGANLRIFALPLFSWVCLAVWVIVWGFSIVHVASVGDVTRRTSPLNFTTEIMWTDEARYMVLYQVFGLLWVAAFINGLCQFIIAASACLWYFTVNTDTKGRGTVGTALYWGFRFHLGSIAFGSFIIAVVQMIRIIFEWYRQKMAKASRDNKVVKALLCLTGYCLYILEKCVKYISKNAYIQVALTNDHFCKAAWNAFALIVANAGRFGMATSVGSILNFFGCGCIGAINGTLAFFVITEADYVVVQNPVYPVVVIVFISIMIANTFMSIFGFSSDAILQSFLLDEQLRFSGSSRPEYMQDFAKSFQEKQKGGCC